MWLPALSEMRIDGFSGYPENKPPASAEGRTNSGGGTSRVNPASDPPDEFQRSRAHPPYVTRRIVLLSCGSSPLA
jgi:hypothetical protein